MSVRTKMNASNRADVSHAVARSVGKRLPVKRLKNTAQRGWNVRTALFSGGEPLKEDKNSRSMGSHGGDETYAFSDKA